MKKIISLMLLVITLFTFALSQPALAADISQGAKVFAANCASCHMGGRNIVKAAKNLSQSTLEKYNMYSTEAIIAQVANGRAAMPAFNKRLKPNQIEDVAAYVLDMAEKDWRR